MIRRWTRTRGDNRGQMLPAVLFLSVVLAIFAFAMVYYLRQEMSHTVSSDSRQANFGTADAILQQVISTLNQGQNWDALALTITADQAETLTITAQASGNPYLSYSDYVLTGDWSNTGTAGGGFFQWGDSTDDRTIFVQVTNSQTNQTDRYYTDIHRDPIIIVPGRQPFYSCSDISTGGSGAQAADCYSSTLGAYDQALSGGGVNAFCCDAALVSSGSVISGLPCYGAQSGQNFTCPQAATTPTEACPLPGLASVDDDYAWAARLQPDTQVARGPAPARAGGAWAFAWDILAKGARFWSEPLYAGNPHWTPTPVPTSNPTSNPTPGATPTPGAFCPGSSSGKTITLGPPDPGQTINYQVHDMNLGNNSLVVDLGGTTTTAVNLYVTGGWSQSGNSSVTTINPAERACGLTIYIVGDGGSLGVTINGNGTMTGLMDAPQALVTVSGGGNGDWFGALVSNGFSRSGGGSTSFHYDTCFRSNSGINDYTNPPIITTGWKRY